MQYFLNILILQIRILVQKIICVVRANKHWNKIKPKYYINMCLCIKLRDFNDGKLFKNHVMSFINTFNILIKCKSYYYNSEL